VARKLARRGHGNVPECLVTNNMSSRYHGRFHGSSTVQSVETLMHSVMLAEMSAYQFYHVRTLRLSTTSLVLPSKLLQRRTQNEPDHSPCRILSASCLFPNSHALRNPCSDSSMFFIELMSCAGGLLTREATMTGSVSRMMPSSTSSSTASDWPS
jgi:hypothetical protein